MAKKELLELLDDCFQDMVETSEINEAWMYYGLFWAYADMGNHLGYWSLSEMFKLTGAAENVLNIITREDAKGWIIGVIKE